MHQNIKKFCAHFYLFPFHGKVHASPENIEASAKSSIVSLSPFLILLFKLYVASCISIDRYNWMFTSLFAWEDWEYDYSSSYKRRLWEMYMLLVTIYVKWYYLMYIFFIWVDRTRHPSVLLYIFLFKY